MSVKLQLSHKAYRRTVDRCATDDTIDQIGLDQALVNTAVHVDLNKIGLMLNCHPCNPWLKSAKIRSYTTEVDEIR